MLKCNFTNKAKLFVVSGARSLYINMPDFPKEYLI